MNFHLKFRFFVDVKYISFTVLKEDFEKQRGVTRNLTFLKVARKGRDFLFCYTGTGKAGDTPRSLLTFRVFHLLNSFSRILMPKKHCSGNLVCRSSW